MVGFRFSALPENGLLKYFNFLYFNMMWVAWESRVWCQTECGVGRPRPPEAVYVSGIDRKQHWDRAWSGRPADRMSWHQDRPGRSLAMIEDAGLAAGDALVDIGGGASTLAGQLLARGYEDVTVLDVSSSALDVARRALGADADRVTWIEQDVTQFRPGRSYRLWHDRAVFHFLLGPADRQRYAFALRQALPPGGQAVIATFAIDGPPRCSGLDVVRYDAEGIVAALGDGLELVDTQHEQHRTPSGAVQAFSYFRFVRSSDHAPDRLQSEDGEQAEEL